MHYQHATTTSSPSTAPAAAAQLHRRANNAPPSSPSSPSSLSSARSANDTAASAGTGTTSTPGSSGSTTSTTTSTTTTAGNTLSRPFQPFHGLFDRNEVSQPDPPPLGDGLCESGSKAVPFTLSTRLSCPPHFYCPNVNATNPMSYPSMCPPTLACQKMRLGSKFCPPQGTYEPVVGGRALVWFRVHR